MAVREKVVPTGAFRTAHRRRLARRLRAVSGERDAPIGFQPAPVRAVVRRAGPRFVRDAFGPLACFFVGWKLIDLTAGILIAAAFGLAIFVHERRAKRPGVVVRMAILYELLTGGGPHAGGSRFARDTEAEEPQPA